MAGGTYMSNEVLPLIAMVTVQCLTVGLNTIFKVASSKGLDYHVFMVYTYAIATLSDIPVVFFFHRNRKIPPIKLSFLLQMFATGFLGFTSQLIGYKGIEFASPTLASVMSNLIPASTFLLAILFKMEILKIKTLSSQAKITGTILSISGALVVVFYKGPTIISNLSPSTSPNSLFGLSTSPNSLFGPSTSQQSQWIIGGALLAVCYIIISCWYILQAKVVTEYPSEIIVVLLYHLSCGIIATPVCFILQPNLSAWRIKPDIALVSVLYAGMIGETTVTLLLTWGLHVKGPVYAAVFYPLAIVIAAFMGVIFLGDALYLGSIIGGIIISSGFYMVTWAKAQEVPGEEEGGDQISSSSSSTERHPLLQSDDVVSSKEAV